MFEQEVLRSKLTSICIYIYHLPFKNGRCNLVTINSFYIWCSIYEQTIPWIGGHNGRWWTLWNRPLPILTRITRTNSLWNDDMVGEKSVDISGYKILCHMQQTVVISSKYGHQTTKNILKWLKYNTWDNAESIFTIRIKSWKTRETRN